MFFIRPKTFILDLDTLSDPRVVEFLRLGLVYGKVLVPKPPEAEMPNNLTVQRAKENLQRLKELRGLEVRLCPEIKTAEDLIQIARRHRATIITTQNTLKSAADGITVVTTTDIFDLLRPNYLPGMVFKVKIAKQGKEKGEGIGYLDGGIKVVVEDAGSAVGQEIEVVVQGCIGTDVGQVVFARLRFSEVR